MAAVVVVNEVVVEAAVVEVVGSWVVVVAAVVEVVESSVLEVVVDGSTHSEFIVSSESPKLSL